MEKIEKNLFPQFLSLIGKIIESHHFVVTCHYPLPIYDISRFLISIGEVVFREEKKQSNLIKGVLW